MRRIYVCFDSHDSDELKFPGKQRLNHTSTHTHMFYTDSTYANHMRTWMRMYVIYMRIGLRLVYIIWFLYGNIHSVYVFVYTNQYTLHQLQILRETINKSNNDVLKTQKSPMNSLNSFKCISTTSINLNSYEISLISICLLEKKKHAHAYICNHHILLSISWSWLFLHFAWCICVRAMAYECLCVNGWLHWINWSRQR